MNYSFEKLQGPRPSRNENFEELIAQLLSAEMSAERVDGKGGDAGIDCFIRGAGNTLIIFQAKYFLNRLTTGQKRQILQSLETACRNHRVSRWILCVPINPTPSERAWFESLMQDGPVLEWWGDTKIRTLLARHPEIAKPFFLDESLVAQLQAFRQEIAGTIAALRTSCWSYGTRGSDLAQAYLKRTKTIGELLILDSALLQSEEEVFIGLDFTELYTYMSSDSRFVAATPVVDFCIQNSPYSLYLLPGAAVELARFMDYAGHHQSFDRHVENLKDHDNPLQHFVKHFEQDPTSEAARQAYKSAIGHLQSMNLPPSFNINISKLRSAFESGKIKAAPEGQPFSADDADVETLFQLLLRGRGHISSHDVERLRRNKFIDLRNLLYLKQYADKTGGPVRMISSDRMLARASRDHFGHASFVRDSPEFAYLIHSIKRCETDGSVYTLESQAKGLAVAAKALGRNLKKTDQSDDLDVLDDKQFLSLIDCFGKFAPYYRNMLRPVDEMIESGLIALSNVYCHDMLDLYRILKRESELVSSFKSWWDDMSEELRAMEDLLRKRYFTERTISEATLLKP